MTDILKRLRAHVAKQESLSRDRDLLILEAKAAGVPVTHIAEAIGLHRNHVHRVIANASTRQEVASSCTTKEES